MPMMRKQLETIKLELERISKLGPLMQVREIWPIVWKLWAMMAVTVEEIEILKNPAQPGKGEGNG